MARDSTYTPSIVIKAVAHFLRALVDEVKDNTLGVQQVMLLMAVYQHGQLNQSDLPRYTGVERSANSRNIARLGAGQWVQNRTTGTKMHEPGLGLVESFEDPVNRRLKLVRLTPQGRAVLESAAAEATRQIDARQAG